MRRLLTLLTITAAFGCGATAQPAEGDIVFTTTAGIFHIPASLSTADSVWPGTGIGGLRLQSVKTEYGNNAVVGGDANGRVFSVRTTGGISQIEQFNTGFVTALDLDNDDRYMCATGVAGMTAVGLSGGIALINPLAGATANGICRNLRNGRWAVVTSSASPYLGELQYDGSGLNRIAVLPAAASGVCYMPDLDTYAVTLLSTSTPLQIYRSNGSLARSIWLPTDVTGNCCTYDTRTRQLYVGTTQGVIYRLDNLGQFISRRSTSRGSISGIDVFGDQRVSVRTPATNPAQARVNLRFSASAGRSYCMALSLSMSSGIAIPGAGTLQMQPDPLFFQTACGGLPFFTSGFTGILSVSGSANAFFTIPAHVPVGTPVHVAAVAIDPAAPGGIAIGNTETVIQH